MDHPPPLTTSDQLTALRPASQSSCIGSFKWAFVPIRLGHSLRRGYAILSDTSVRSKPRCPYARLITRSTCYQAWPATGPTLRVGVANSSTGILADSLSNTLNQFPRTIDGLRSLSPLMRAPRWKTRLTRPLYITSKRRRVLSVQAGSILRHATQSYRLPSPWVNVERPRRRLIHAAGIRNPDTVRSSLPEGRSNRTRRHPLPATSPDSQGQALN